MGELLQDERGQPHGPRLPLPVDDTVGGRADPKSETLTYNGKAVAGAISVNGLNYRNIMNPTGTRMGSYWGNEDNFVYGTNEPLSGVPIAGRTVGSIVTTPASATVSVNDPSNDLEKMFESLTTTVKRYVLKAYDSGGNSLYGWIFGVAKSGSLYTFDIVNNRLAQTQSWVGTVANFTGSLSRIEIYSYQGSVSFGTGTTFTEEVGFTGEYGLSLRRMLEAALALSNGQYFVDYKRGLLLGKRADTTASETVSFVVSSVSSSASAGAPATSTSLIPSAQDLSGSWVDLGPEISTAGLSRIGLWLKLTANNSSDMRVRCLAKLSANASDEYTLTTLTNASSVIYAEDEYIELTTDANQVQFLEFGLNGLIPLVQFQVQTGTVGATAGQVAAAGYTTSLS